MDLELVFQLLDGEDRGLVFLPLGDGHVEPVFQLLGVFQYLGGDLEHPVFQHLDEDSQFLVAGAQHPGTLDHHGTDVDGGLLADGLLWAADDLLHLAECCLEIAAALVTPGPCRSAGSLF